MLRNLMRPFLWGCLFLSILSFVTLYVVNELLNKPLLLDEPQSYLIKEGSNLTRVVRELKKKNILEFPNILLAYARAAGQTDIRAGEYRLTTGETPLSLLNKLSSGDVIYYQVTIPEGLTVKQWLGLLRQEPKLSGEKNPDSTALLSFIEGNPEGWLFPDTYRYHLGETSLVLLRNAHKRMQETLQTEWQQRSADLPYRTSYEALIMASIIEKETGVAEERQKIAGVFVRRLQKGMRLQTDPTVIYGLGENYDGNLTRQHLRQKTAYNTYVIKGLPPTPIANPGAEAIYAALHPAQGDELYFVAKGDGSHHFSTTLAEHEEAVRRYQRSGRQKNYRSSPK